jgi:hypothetical protein
MEELESNKPVVGGKPIASTHEVAELMKILHRSLHFPVGINVHSGT